MKLEIKHMDYQGIIETTNTDIVVGVDRTGNEVSVLASKNGVTRDTATNIFPVVVDEYEWTREDPRIGCASKEFKALVRERVHEIKVAFHVRGVCCNAAVEQVRRAARVNS
jgi:hypothetical protein